MNTNRRSWVMDLPHGLREQPAWVFIGTLTSLTGLSYLLGFAQSATIARVLEQPWIRVWGGFLCFAGVLVVVSTVSANKPLEKLALRFLSLGFLVYMGWVLTAAPLNRAMVTVAMCTSLVILAEIRVAVLKVVLKPLPVYIRRSELER